MSTPLLAAWIYARRSRVSENQASVKDQISQGRDVIDASGWQLGEDHILNEEASASRYAKRDRETWPVLLEAIGAGKVGVLVLWESSRGDRKAAEWLAFLELCEEHRTLIHVISHDRTYNPANHRDWKTLASEGVDNDHYTRRLSAEIKKGKRGAVKRGRPQGAPPYGYRVRYDPRTGRTAGWDAVRGQDETVRRIVCAAGRHVPAREIARRLNADGVPSATGGRWQAEAVRVIARNPSYAGLIRLPDGTLAGRDPAYPAIVERHEHEGAVAALAGREPGTRPGRVVHLLSYISACDCGALIEADGEGRYRCTGGHPRVDEAWLDETVGYLVCAKLARDDARDLYADDGDGRAAALRAELGPLRARRRKYIARAADGDEDADEILAALKPRIARLERQLGEVRYVPALRDILTVGDTFSAWQGYTVQARRQVITAVTGIVVMRTGRPSTRAQRYDTDRVVTDWQPQPPRRPGRTGRPLSRG